MKNNKNIVIEGVRSSHLGQKITSRKWKNNKEIVMSMKKSLMTLNLLLAPYIERYKKIRKRGNLKKETIKSFKVKDPKFAKFYLIPKIHK